jgi:uncharacterized membrane protein HdeD (DUF308 family)
MESIVSRKPRYWWVFMLQGIILLALGIYMLFAPVNGFAALGFLFGLAILLTGIFELLRVIRDRDQASRAWHLLLGVINIILGIILVGHIGTSEAILRIVLGLWFLFSGISLMSFSRLTGRNWLLTAGGVIVVLFALAIIFKPVFGAVTIDLLIAVAFIVTGLFEVVLGYRLKH